MTLLELSRVTKIDRNSLSRIENGRGNPTVETLERIELALGITIKVVL